jgi:hypothetical protein
MSIFKRTIPGIAAIAFAASASMAFAQELPPPPPSDFMCNGVTCEGYIVTGYDPITGDPIYSYVVFPDINAEAPAPR